MPLSISQANVLNADIFVRIARAEGTSTRYFEAARPDSPRVEVSRKTEPLLEENALS